MPHHDIMQMPVTDIDIQARLREASPTAVASIASSILEVGEILKPLIVRKVKSGYRLLDGLHRLEAAKQIGHDTVPVQIRTCTNNQAVRIEVDANIAGAPLNALDMAVFLAAHKALYEKEHPEAKLAYRANQARRGECMDIMSVQSFADNAAEVFGKSDRHIRRLIRVGEQLDPKHIDLLRHAPQRVQFSDLELIAKCGNPIDRIDICEALHHGTAKSAKEVLNRKKAPGVAVKSPVEQAQSKITDAWARAPKDARRRFVAAHLDQLIALMDSQDAQVIPFQSRREATS